jgi:hypothetical protein
MKLFSIKTTNNKLHTIQNQIQNNTHKFKKNAIACYLCYNRWLSVWNQTQIILRRYYFFNLSTIFIWSKQINKSNFQLTALLKETQNLDKD